MNKTIRFNEIIECSNQKSILTGQAGFGIRTITKGLDPDLARKVASQMNNAYEVDINRQVSKRDIVDNPGKLTEYPRTFKYNVVTDNDGKEKYIFACSTYVGIDYGYFCNIDSYQRPGSNYISNILIFDEKPAANLFYELLRQKVFMPIDNTCSPDNPELKRLLTGEPEYLEPRSIEIPEVSDCAEHINETTANVAIALLQTKINKDLGKGAGMQSIVIQAEEAKKPFGANGPVDSHQLDVIKSFASMSDGLMADKFFQTNYQQGHGMPKGYRIMFLNQYNREEVYIEDYVYLNVDTEEFKNVSTDNYFFGKLKEVARSNDHQVFRNLVKYLYSLTIHPDSDFAFLYNLYNATEKTEVLDIDVLNEDFFQKVKKANLPADKLIALKKNISKTLSAAIPGGDIQTDKFGKAMKVITLLLGGYREFLDEFESDKKRKPSSRGSDEERATNYLFINSQNFHYLQELPLGTIRYICNYDVDKISFYNALSSVSTHNVWMTLADDFYRKAIGTTYDADSEKVITEIIKSPTLNDKACLVKNMFPVRENMKMLASYIETHIESIKDLQPIIVDICHAKGLEGIFYFLRISGCSNVAVNILQPIAEEYFDARISGGANIGELCEFLERIKQEKANNILPASFRGFDFSRLYAQYEAYCHRNPRQANEKWIDIIRENGGHQLDKAKKTCEAIKIIDNYQPSSSSSGGSGTRVCQKPDSKGRFEDTKSKPATTAAIYEAPEELHGNTETLILSRDSRNRKNIYLPMFLKWAIECGDEKAMGEILKGMSVKDFESFLSALWMQRMTEDVYGTGKVITLDKQVSLTHAMLDAFKWPKNERVQYIETLKTKHLDKELQCIRDHYGFKPLKFIANLFKGKSNNQKEDNK